MTVGDLVVQMRNVGVAYRRRAGFMRSDLYWALRDVSFDLNHGETLGVIGRNGAGKSTLLRILAGIMAPDSGELFNHGYRASLLSLQVGFVPHLTGRENAVLSALLLGMGRKAIENKIDEIIEFSELEEFIDQPAHTYSMGMRARLGFSVAYQADPDILLIDEVLGVGDAPFKKKSAAAIHEKIGSNKSVVLVSHVIPTIRSLCDRVVWIENGRTRMEGATEEVLDAYQAVATQPPAGSAKTG
jgi:lipopolysaccharide transport system ATP-binding protein